MKKISGSLFLIIAALPYVTMLWSRTPVDEPASGRAETLLVMSPHRREVRQEYGRGFREHMLQGHARNVAVRWLDTGGTSKMLKDLESRYAVSPGAPGVDIMFGGGVAPYYQADRRGWLERVHLPAGTLAAIPVRCAGAPVYDSGGRWYGVALSGFGILYNRVLVERMGLPEPATWVDLARPEFLSWLGSGDPRSSGSVHMCYEIVLQAYGFEKGWSLITRICGNVRRFGEGGGAAPREVAAGEVAAGMVIDQYAQTVVDAMGAGALVFVLPKDATNIGADAIAVLRGAAHRELAELFVAYVLSVPGQRLLFQPAGRNGQRHALHRMPVVKTLYDDPAAPETRPYQLGGQFEYDIEKGSRRWRIINDLIGVWLIDAHPDLVRAWQAVIRGACVPERVDELGRAPCSEEQLMAMAAQWDDPRVRLKITRKWARAATQRYRRLRND